MQKGKKALIIHTINTLIVCYSLIVTLIFYPCFGFERAEDYSIFFNNWEHTVLFYLYALTVVMAVFVVVFLCVLVPVPYCIIYWRECFRNPVLDNKRIGALISVFALLLLLLHWVGNLLFDPVVYGAIDSGLLILITIYLLPYLFIRLSYPQINKQPLFGIYRKLLIFQLVAYALIVVYWITPLPSMLSEFIDDKYLSPWAR